MLEKDAKTKWCPFARVLKYHDGGAANRNLDPESGGTLSKHALCIGSDCMGWTEAGDHSGDCGMKPMLFEHPKVPWPGAVWDEDTQAWIGTVNV